MSLRIHAIEKMSDIQSKPEDTSKLHNIPHEHEAYHHGGGVLGVIGGLGHALEDVLVSKSRTRMTSTGEEMTTDERHWRHVAEEERTYNDFHPEVAPDTKVNTNPTPSDDKTTTTGQQHISHLTHAWPEPDSKLMVGSNPKATPSSQEEMEQVRIHMEKMGKQPFNKTVSHPEHVPRPVEKDISGEERPAISEFDRALDKLTGVYNNAHLMAEDIHSHPELSKKTYRRHKSESENKTSEEMFEEALDKISSAYGSSHITARDRLSGKSDEGVAYQWRLTEKGDSRKQLDEALDKLTAPFNSTRITPEEMLDANTLPSKETVKPGIQEPGQSRDYFEEAAHKLTAVYSSSADQADDIQHIVDEEFHIAHGKPPINVPEARNRTPLDDALDSLQNKLHKGLHVEDFPRYHWPEVPQEQRTKEGEAHPITDAVKDLMTKSKEMAEHGLEKSQEMAEQGVEKGKELSGSATEKGKELAESALQKGKEVTGTALEKGKEVTGSALERGKEMSGSAIEKGKEMLPEVEFAGRKNEPVNQTYAPASDIPERELNERAIESIKHYTKPVHQTYEPARDIDRKSELAREGMSTADSTIDKTGLDFERYRGAGSGALRQRILQEGQEGEEPAEREIVSGPKNTDIDPKSFLIGNQKLQVAEEKEPTMNLPQKRGIFSKISGMFFGKKEQAPTGSMTEHPQVSEISQKDQGESVEKATNEEALILT